MTEYPKELTPALKDVLSQMIFQIAPIAEIFRADGVEIKRKAEEEQSFLLHWMIGLAIEHGDDWRRMAAVELNERVDSAKAKRDAIAARDSTR